MINLLVAYYENIGPFKETCCSLFFDEGKYLIKAPIGSGKSFLFFDAPKYALYKDSSRNMLNLQSKNGEISLIFEVDDSYFLIKRILKTTRMGNDSCSSQLFNISYNGDNLLKDIQKLTGKDEILQWGEDVIEKFEESKGKLWDLEEIAFKNESDLQATFESFLPPKEVFMSTVFLLQDADNIFEMRPADRLIVLKNVFNLLGIDDAKDKVLEKKKEVGIKLKALQDHSLQDNKLRLSLKGLWNNIKELEGDEELKTILSENNSFFEDIEGFFDTISINDFSMNGFDNSVFDKTELLIKGKVDEVIKLDAQLNEFQQQLSNLNNQKIKNLSDISNTKNDIISLEDKIKSIDTSKGEELKKRKIELYDKSELLQKNAKYSVFNEFIDFWNKASENDDSFERLNYPIDLKSAYDILQTAKDAGVGLKSIIEMLKTKLENIDLQAKNWKENHDREIERLKDIKSRKEDEIKQQKLKIEELDKMWSENSDFDCPDLCKKCPHINAINKQQFEQYSKKKDDYLSKLKDLELEFNNQNYDRKIKDLENQKNPEGDDYKKDLEEKIKKQSDFSSSLKNYLIKIGYADWEKSYHEWESINVNIQGIDRQLLQWEEESKNIDKYRQDKVVAENTLKHLEESLEDLYEQIDTISSKVDIVNNDKLKINSQLLKKQQSEIKQCSQYVMQIEQLIDDNVNNKNMYNKLVEDEKKLGRLHSILSKEIVLFALGDYLPILSDIINEYLSQCVGYKINMSIVENNDKLELNASIIDDKGEREVKSLSGGQRTILKLVWMLAISSYLRTPLLFLDETINNLDVDTVGRVSEMIDNFVKQRSMKFYTVTHNKEIQDMQIWDDVIEISKVESLE